MQVKNFVYSKFYLLTVSLLVFPFVIANAQSYMLKPVKKINCQRAEQIFVDSTELYWLSTQYRSAYLWKKNKLKKIYQIPISIHGQLQLVDNNRKISGGYFEYNIKQKKSIKQNEDIEPDPIQNILDAISPLLYLNRFIYQVENSLFDIKANRLVMALHHRPSRRGDPKLDIEIPSNIFGLVKLDTKELISILDHESISGYSVCIITDQYIVGFSNQNSSDSLTIWKLENGEQVLKLPFHLRNINTLSRIPNKESFIITFDNGDVIEYDILQKRQIVLKKGGTLTQKVFALGFDSLYMFFEDNTKGILYKRHHEKMEIIDKISLNGKLTDFYFNQKTKHLWIATDSDNYAVKIYKLIE